MQVRVRSLIPIAIVSNRDAFVIHNTHLPAPACRTKRGGASVRLTRSLTVPSLAPSQAPAQSQAAYSYGNQQMAPNPYAMWPQVRLTSAFNPTHPAHTLATPPSLVREEKKRSSPDA